MSCLRYVAWVVLLCLISDSVVAQSPSDQTARLFENNIRPVLVGRCIKCHGPVKAESGLRLDQLQSLLVGGDSGPTLLPGDAAGSLLVQVLDHQHDIKMPPDKALNEIEIQAFRDWIAQGARWPDQLKLTNGPELRSGSATQAELAFWAFQPLKVPTPPPIENSPRIHNDIDRFVLAKLKEQALSANQAAEKQLLIRRVSYDLTGLPPTPEAVEQFVNDKSPIALDRLLDRLLNSRAYGERWGRHWLDVVRYSDTAGETADYPIPDAWRYRNYVIDSFNQDKPYDQFLREQLAGDILAQKNVHSPNFAEQVTATGFIAIARRFGFDSENYHHLTIQDTIDTVGQAILGMSIGCARCHDHKFDPLSMEDYYALYGIFDSTLYPLAGSEQKPKVRSLVPLRAEQTQPVIAAQQAKLTARKQELLQQLGRPIPPVILRSLTELDGDFELQSPAAGGSRGVLVGQWQYDGPIAVTNAAQSPFAQAVPKGKVGLSFPAGQALAGIWQALNQRSLDVSKQPLRLSVDIRAGTPDKSPSQTADVAADLVTTARSLTSTQHHGLSIELCKTNLKSVIALSVGTTQIDVQVGDHLLNLGTIEAGKWYHIELRFSPEGTTVSGLLQEHNGAATNIELSIPSLPTELMTLLKVQTSRLTEEVLPTFELDNLAITPGELAMDAAAESFEQLAELGNAVAIQSELAQLVGTDGDLELQSENQPPSAPWGPGPNSLVKIAARSQSPFRNYFNAGRLGLHLPNRAEYDGFDLRVEKLKPNDAGHILAAFDFCCASQDAGGSGSWRYYLGHGPGNSAAIELFFNGSQFFCRSGNETNAVASIEIGSWYQVQLEVDPQAKTYAGKLVSSESETEFSGQTASGWDGTIDCTFIDSYGHIAGIRPALDADNFSFGRTPKSASSSSESTLAAAQPAGNSRIERVRELRGKLAAIQIAADELQQQLIDSPADMGYAVAEGTPHNVPIHLRGEPSQPGKVVARRMPQLFASPGSATENLKSELTGSGRLDLANWITQDAKSLAARVMVNRVWQQHFGRGLVRTENDFGTRGEPPTHPELLDWLASRFIESGWSVKQLHRLIIHSATYQQSSQTNELCSQVDPDNRWLWRFTPRRLSAEEIRDTMLLVSGKLDPSPGKEHPFPPPQTWGFTQHSPFYAVYETNRRSVYLMQQRIKRHPFLALFDGADPNVSTARRENTIVPTQALYLMNNALVHESAMGISESCATASSPVAAIDALYQRCLSRQARQDEMERAVKFLEQYAAMQTQLEPAGEHHTRSAWAALARTLITRNEFLFVE
jgi:Protein of unknown function (DUF1553)/Protein of unknown function (DUF1549)/Planctomycete cytochrome C